MVDLYAYADYKAYLRNWIRAQPSRGHGWKSKIAQHLRCQTSYVSQVLGGSANLSLEQAEALSSLLGLDAAGYRYFLLTVQYGRAGTPGLRRYFQAEMDLVRETRRQISHRIGAKQPLTSEAQATYYSSWHYAAIHVLLSIPGFDGVRAISEKLRLAPTRTQTVLAFLLSVGMAKLVGGRYRIGEVRIHLAKDSPLVAKHHSNWRSLALRQLDESEDRSELHYSSAITLSRADAERIREILLQAIASTETILGPSQEEVIYCLAADFFEIGRSR